MRTQVGIVGAGPAGLMLSHLLHLRGIESVVLEARSREYVESRIRAGVLEHGTAALLAKSGVGARMLREGMAHHGIHLSFGGRRHRIDLTGLTGRSITVYGQHELIKDLIKTRLDGGGEIIFDAEQVSLHGLDTPAPTIRYRKDGQPLELACDFVGGCDGSHGVCRHSPPRGALAMYERNYPFAWLGILAKAPPSSAELVYAYHDSGFALFSMRSAEITRLYLQCEPEEDIGSWSDERIWKELKGRLSTEDGWAPTEGPILQKNISAMHSFVVEPMQYGRLFLAGDAAHLVPPTGAKGMNLALADVSILAPAIAEYYRSGSFDLLDRYSETCLHRVWNVQRFSWWMTSMLHCFPDHNEFDRRRQLAELEYVTTSRAAATALAENYVG